MCATKSELAGAEVEDERDRGPRQHGRLGDCTSCAMHCQDRVWAQKGPLGGRWVDINKGDDKNKEVRGDGDSEDARRNAREGLFAAMPHLEELRLVISLTVSEGQKVHVKDVHKMMSIDISKAYLHADVINNELSVEFPAEMNLRNSFGHLKKALYGTRVLGEELPDDHGHARVRQK